MFCAELLPGLEDGPKQLRRLFSGHLLACRRYEHRERSTQVSAERCERNDRSFLATMHDTIVQSPSYRECILEGQESSVNKVGMLAAEVASSAGVRVVFRALLHRELVPTDRYAGAERVRRPI